MNFKSFFGFSKIFDIKKQIDILGNNIKKVVIKIEGPFEFDKELEIYKDAFNITDQFITILDNQMSIKIVNDAMLALIHDDTINIYDTPYWELPIWQHSAELQNQIMFSMEMIYLGEEVSFEATYPDIKGDIRNIEFTIKPLYDENDDIFALVAMGYDITNAKLTEKKLQQIQDQLTMFFDMAVDGFFISNMEFPVKIKDVDINAVFDNYVLKNDKIVKHNKSVYNILEIDVNNVSVFDLYSTIINVSPYVVRKYWIDMISKGHIIFNLNFISSLSFKKYAEFSMVPIIENDMYYGCYATIKDITAAKNNEEYLFMLANFDYLTGVCNRRYFIESIHDILSESSRDSMCMVMFDIDYFKSINDSHGHDVGDWTLRVISNEINTIISSDGLFARMGGEEFAAIVYKNLDETIVIVEKVLYAVRQASIQTDLGLCVKVTISVGITLVKKGEGYSDFFKRADLALYEAKHTGRDKYCIK